MNPTPVQPRPAQAAVPRPVSTPTASSPPSAAKATPATAPHATVASPNRRNLILACAGGGVLVLLAALFIWKPWVSTPPRLNEEPYKIAKFAASASFESLDFNRQYTYMELLDDKEDAVRKAYDEGKLTDDEFRKALQVAYFGRHLSRMEKFMGKPRGPERIAYLDKLIEKKKGGQPDPDEESSDSLSPLKASEIKRDESRQEAQINAWPDDIRAKWMEYRQALSERKEYHKAQKAAATQSTAEKPAK